MQFTYDYADVPEASPRMPLSDCEQKENGREGPEKWRDYGSGINRRYDRQAQWRRATAWLLFLPRAASQVVLRCALSNFDPGDKTAQEVIPGWPILDGL